MDYWLVVRELPQRGLSAVVSLEHDKQEAFDVAGAFPGRSVVKLTEALQDRIARKRRDDLYKDEAAARRAPDGFGMGRPSR